MSKSDSAKIFTVEEEIARVDVNRPHVVIVGSGASAAAFPKGDRNGNKLPTMANFSEVLGLDSILKGAGFRPPYNDFEGIFTKILDNPSQQDVVWSLERRIDEYFRNLELPETATLYDHLLLSLRPKDVIATFNWDPFLCQACVRNAPFTEMPRVLFLHGNAAIGYCQEHMGVRGPLDGQCWCGEPFQPTKLLYPVARKNYNADGFISWEWKALKEVMRSAFALTFFGYGAPKTDVEAVSLLRDGWGSAEERIFEETEFIDTKKENELLHTWADFVHSHHYKAHASFYDSLLAKHPRRTCEHLWARLMEGRWPQAPRPFPKTATLDEFQRLLQPKIDAEKLASRTWRPRPTVRKRIT